MTIQGYRLKAEGYLGYLKGVLVYRDILTIMPMYRYQYKQLFPDVDGAGRMAKSHSHCGNQTSYH